jgi:hypothetical protein
LFTGEPALDVQTNDFLIRDNTFERDFIAMSTTFDMSTYYPPLAQSLVENNTITECYTGIFAGPAPELVTNNRISKVCAGIIGGSQIECNTLSYTWGDAINCQFQTEIKNNTINYAMETALTVQGANTVMGNSISNSWIALNVGAGNTVYLNSFINNTHQIIARGNNNWDNGYLTLGNYWSDYKGTDKNNDGIGDTPYVIDAYNTDRYPIMMAITTPYPSPTPTPTQPPVPETLTFIMLSLVLLIGTVLIVLAETQKRKPIQNSWIQN